MMNLNTLIFRSAFCSLLVFMTSDVPTVSASSSRFECVEISGEWTTRQRTTQQPLIKWVDTYFNYESLTPKNRCFGSTQRLNQSKDLKLIKSYRGLNGTYKLCTASYEQGPCMEELFKLRPGSNPIETANELMGKFKNGRGPAIRQTGGSVIIDLSGMVKD